MNEEKASLVAHFRELKTRLIYSLVFFFLSFILAYYFVEQLYIFLLKPLSMQLDLSNRYLIYTNLAEVFFSYLKLAYYSALILTIPFFAIQIYLFMAPGLYRNEKKAITPFLIFSPVLFILGACFVYYFIFPIAWDFFLSFQNSNVAGFEVKLEAKVSEYLSICLNLILAFGIAFQLPIVILLLAKMGIVDANGLARNRKYAVVSIFVLAAILTPPDAITQIALAIPMLMLYELSIILSK